MSTMLDLGGSFPFEESKKPPMSVTSFRITVKLPVQCQQFNTSITIFYASRMKFQTKSKTTLNEKLGQKFFIWNIFFCDYIFYLQSKKYKEITLNLKISFLKITRRLTTSKFVSFKLKLQVSERTPTHSLKFT